MLIKNVILVCDEQTFLGYVRFYNGQITAVGRGLTDEEGIDGKGQLLMPAYWDLHTHGGYGFSFNELADFDEEAAKLYLNKVAEEGVCAVLATCVTDSRERIQKIMKNYEKLKKLDELDILKGLYFEGPFISKIKKGAHDPSSMLQLSIDSVNEILGPSVRVITVTPESDASQIYEAIAFASKSVSVSVGHTNATAEQFLMAIDHGANRVTHLYNAMTGFQHRIPGVVNGVFASKGLFVELIPDGEHVDPFVVRQTLDLLDERHKFVFVSDSLSLKGLPDGQTRLGPMSIEKRGDFCYLLNSASLAGSCLPYDRLVQRFKSFCGADPCAIAKWTSSNPALSLGILDEGAIKEGSKASFVLLDKSSFKLISVFIRGRQII